MKKKILIIVCAIFSFFVLAILGLGIYYKVSLGATGDSKDEVVFVIDSGTSSKEIINNLYTANLIKNKYTGYLYLKMHSDIMLQAGVYNLNRGMNMSQIMNSLVSGDVVDNSKSITFVEGKRVTYVVSQISKEFGYSEEEIYSVLGDKGYLEELIKKYWFLTDDILNDKLYYALEGYLYPNTYAFKEDATIKDIIEKMLNATDNELSRYKKNIEDSGYSVHEILSMASIVELEAVTKEDRASVAQVIFKRLELGMTLGMDVTTYYAVKKDMSEELWYYELDKQNPYNTRVVSGLPVGPICNPSVESINAVFNPSKTNYIYFYADVKTGKVYFAETEKEFYQFIKKYGV